MESRYIIDIAAFFMDEKEEGNENLTFSLPSLLSCRLLRFLR